ncbi:dynein assembly factor 3, axonemal-like [Plakobranchus ocellatus]|uniref:Dynein assembly factor 3, axonemal-like n=1 Tax=Plakobranchus ocellatus TaxID=259542 RepID=A0AAV3YW44_9GAST|nr:dynein assembly factor 3, axonemal-like [Plakobranchus ocellatus]
MTDAYGNINWWGFSPALDLQDIGHGEMCKKLSCAVPDELHILLVGAGDIRHILKTLARRYRHSKRKLKFYVVENSLELYVRDMLLMMVALEKQSRMGLQEKTELFLELYGNTHMREQSNKYSELMAHELIKMVTDFDYLEEKLPLFDLTQLKYKERDFLEGILKFLRNREKTPFDIAKCWDLRLRQQLNVRYDSMKNVFDWDYNMELIERGGSIVHMQQYKHWRQFGVAFQIREGTYDVPNRTLASATVFKMNGERFPRRGFWGDMIVSPFIAFGVETEEKSFYKKQNNQHIKTAEDVSEFNINSLFHELATNEKYELPKVDDAKSVEKSNSDSKLKEITEEDEGNEENEESESKKKEEQSGDTVISAESEERVEEEKKLEAAESIETQQREDVNNSRDKTQENNEELEWMKIEDAKVIFLPLNSLADMINKPKYQKRFNAAFFSNSMVHHLKPEISSLFTDHASLILETALFMLDLKKDHVKEFVSKITGMAQQAGFKVN